MAPVISGRQGCLWFGSWAFAMQAGALSHQAGMSRVPCARVLAHD